MSMPKGVKLKKPKVSRPRSRKMPLTIMLGVVATRVIMPLISAARASGMSSRLGLIRVFSATERVMGIYMAAVAVELMNATTEAAAPIIVSRSRASSPAPWENDDLIPQWAHTREINTSRR